MMDSILRRSPLMILAGLVVAAGCTGPATDRPPTEKVGGTVTLGGNPVEGAIVTFVFATADGASAVGTTDANGKYTLTTWEAGDGALAGDYTVKIVKFESAAADESGVVGDEEPPDLPTNPYDTGEQTNLLPQKYSNPGTSGLTAKVVAGSNTIDFHLEE